MISLSDTEKKIFNKLLEINDDNSLGLTFRVAGGWVRDKIMGNDSDDIDISIDKMTGKEFGQYIKNDLNLKTHVIEANHDQCKHLEVVRIKMFETEIDILHLRSEEYGTTRIPTIQIGTPEEDAFRRDLTINSLFYNINKGTVEDFTEMGVRDIRDGIIRTPLDPHQTFLDDPLRILRAIRFSVRFNFKLDDSIVKTVSVSKDIHDSFKTRVSIERVIVEIRKSIKYSALDTVRLINQMNLFDIFEIPHTDEIQISLEKVPDSLNMIEFLSLVYLKSRADCSSTVILNKISKLERDTVIKLIDCLKNYSLNDSTLNEVTVGNILRKLGNDNDVNMFLTLLLMYYENDEYNYHKQFINSLRWTISMKPALDGFEIMKLYNVKGKDIKKIMDKVIDLQISNKDYTKEWIISVLKVNTSTQS